MTYASATSVPAHRTRSEIEALLQKHGATGFGFVSDSDRGIERMEFKMPMRGNVLVVRLEMPIPDREQFRYDTRLHRTRSADDQQRRFDQAYRSAWRALLLILKAKLVAVEQGARTFEQEFLYDIVIGSGQQTLGQNIAPRLSEAVAGGMLSLPPASSHA